MTTNPPTPSEIQERLTIADEPKVVTGDPQVVVEAVDDALALSDPSFLNEVLRDAKFFPHIFERGEAFSEVAYRLSGDGRPRGSRKKTRQISDFAFLRLLAASSSPLKEVDAIAIDTGDSLKPLPFDDLSWLSEFPNLSKVHLFGSNITNKHLASLANVQLDQLGVSHYGNELVLPSHSTIQSLVGGGIDFEDGGSWPNLRSVSLAWPGPVAPLLDGSPNLVDLRIDSMPTNWISGMAYEQRELTIVSSASLKRAVVLGPYIVQNVPELVELELGGRAMATGTPKLEKQRQREVQSERDAD